jgi:hypothetical protein
LNQPDFVGRADRDQCDGAKSSKNLSSCSQGKKSMIFIIDDDEEARVRVGFCLNAQA